MKPNRTSSNQWNDGKNPTPEDGSRYIHVHHNTFVSKGNEVDVKEGTEYVLIEHNTCTEQLDPNSACLDSRADNIIFRYNEVFNNVGAAVRIGGHNIKGHQYGQGCEVYGNTFRDNKEGALKVQTGPHKSSTLCENQCQGTCEVGGSVSVDYKDIEGKCSGYMDTFWVDGTKAELDSDSEDSDDSMEEEIDGEPDINVSVVDNSIEEGKRTLKATDTRCFPIKIDTVKASSEEGQNTPRSAVDGKSITRWSSKGKDEWLELDFGSPVIMNAVEISFFKGDERKQSFEVFAEGKAVLENKKSSGKTLALQKFPFEETTGSSLTIMAKGNSVDDWNSLTEVIVCGKSEPNDTRDSSSSDGDSSECEDMKKLEINRISATSDDGENKIGNVLDGNLNTLWSGSDKQEVVIVLDKPSFILDIGIAVHKGDKRESVFDVMALTTSHGWEDIIVDGKSTKGLGIESYDMGVEGVEEVKVIFYGYQDSETGEMGTWNSITGIELYGC